jgi:hypothetical protein
LSIHSDFGKNQTVTSTLLEDLHAFLNSRFTRREISQPGNFRVGNPKAGNSQATHKGQMSNSGERTRIVTLCVGIFPNVFNFCKTILCVDHDAICIAHLPSGKVGQDPADAEFHFDFKILVIIPQYKFFLKKES